MNPGDRIRVIAMPEDPNPIPAGEMGTVQGSADFDDCSWRQVYVKWDSGRTLMLCIPPDVVEVVTPAADEERLNDAAPDMLAALQAIVFQTAQGSVFERDACITAAKAAIAKATERSEK
jgi:hypothetical protein